MVDTSVVYLFRKGESFSLVKKFIFSYKKNYPKEAHIFYIIFKGFSGPNENQVYKVKNLLKGVKFREVYYDDTGYDITVYLKITQIIETDFIIFLNSKSEIKKNNWFQMLRKAIKMDKTILAGATASLESYKNSNLYVYLIAQVIKKMPAFYNIQFIKFFAPFAPKSYFLDLKIKNKIKLFLQYLFIFSDNFKFLAKFFPKRGPDDVLDVVVADELFNCEYTFPSSSWIHEVPIFPNPHIRTTAFIVDRSWLKENFKKAPLSKDECLLFESGINGLSSTAIFQGYHNALVTSEKIYFDYTEWHQAGSFRSGKQSSLLVSDNHTRIFENETLEAKASYAIMTWGYNDKIISYYKLKAEKFALNVWKRLFT